MYYTNCRYAKGHWTQLQWIFEAVPVSHYFPLGAKTTYRSYSKFDVIEIVEDPASHTEVKFKPITTSFPTCPQSEVT
jgi:hypothetical protein